MLQRHPDVAIPPESHFIPDLWRRRRRYGRDGRVHELEVFATDLFADARFREWGLSREAIVEELERLGELSVAGAIDSVYDLYARREGKSRWGDKTPRYVDDVPLLAGMFPKAHFVHVIRDGRDVALSVLDLKRLHRHAASAAFVWSRQVRRGRGAGRAVGPERYLELRYERFVEDPEDGLRQVAGFLSLPFDEIMLAHDARGLERIPPRLQWMHQRLALPPTRGLRDWRKDMRPSDVADFEAIAGRELMELGYPLSGTGRGPVVKARAWGRIAGFGLRSFRSRLQWSAKRA
jgi:hypothetical protein